MYNLLVSEIEKLPPDHTFHQLQEWHLRQCIRQIRERAKKMMIPPFTKIEQYRGQGRLVSKLYAVLLTNNSSTIQDFLLNLSFEDARKLMWQRFTSSSYVSDDYFPPVSDEMERMITSEDTTALFENLKMKADNCHQEYWDIAIEEARERSLQSGRDILLEVLDFFLDEFTWWNTYPLETTPIFELRDPSGHGIRFDLDSKTLLSFVEPDEDGIIFTMNR